MQLQILGESQSVQQKNAIATTLRPGSLSKAVPQADPSQIYIVPMPYNITEVIISDRHKRTHGFVCIYNVNI